MTASDTKIKLREVAALAQSAALMKELPLRMEAEAREKAEAGAVRVVGGFKFHDPNWTGEKLEEAKKARAYDVEVFEKKKETLTEKLKSIGVDPIAIVPASYWDEITLRHDLITLRPSLDGKVAVSGHVAHEAGKKVGERTDSISAFFAGAGVIAAIFRGFYLGFGTETFGQFVGAVVTDQWMWGALFLLVSAVLISSLVKGYFVGKALDRWIATHSEADLLRAISEGRSSTGQRALLRLPDPPADVVELLRKMVSAKWEFEVVAEAGAIALNPPARELFHTSYKMREEELEALRRDPIICVRDGGVIAVLAQFGEFKWEKAVVEDVVWSKPLPKSHEY